MMKEALAYFPLKFMPMLGLALFLFMFLMVVLWVYRRSGKKVYEHLSFLPLADELENSTDDKRRSM
jgi:cbb3-type cytochrome oxidase subunit 3